MPKIFEDETKFCEQMSENLSIFIKMGCIQKADVSKYINTKILFFLRITLKYGIVCFQTYSYEIKFFRKHIKSWDLRLYHWISRNGQNQ